MAFSDNLRASRRITVTTIAFGLCALVIVGRLFEVQVVRSQEYVAKADAQQERKFQIPAKRGQIFLSENDGLYPVALNQSLKLLYADPKFIINPQQAAEELAVATGLDPTKLKSDLTFDGKKRYIVLKEKVSTEEAAKIAALKLAGIVLTDKDYRYYSEPNLFAHVLGYVNTDGEGQYGLEQYLNDDLAGQPGQVKAVTDSLGVPIISQENTINEPQNGNSYVLTIDRSIQDIAARALKDAVEKNRADSGSIVVMDPKTGAIKALVNYPSFDPNNYGNVKPADYHTFINSAVSSQFEPGSGFKVITMAAGIDSGKVKADMTYNDTGEVKVADRTIKNADNHKFGLSSMSDVIQKSLNTGVVFVLKQLGGDPNKITRSGKELFNKYIKNFGFGERTGVELAGEATGKVRDAKATDVDYANMTFGQGLSVTTMQMMQAVGVIANGGTLYQPYLVDKTIIADQEVIENKPKVARDRVISQQSAAIVASMMQKVVERGSGYATRMKGYNIAGKTGTAQVPRSDGQGYDENKNIGSFVGFAPTEDPKFVMMVRIDYPRVSGFAEKTAVPAFGVVAKELLKYYQIPPSK